MVTKKKIHTAWKFSTPLPPTHPITFIMVYLRQCWTSFGITKLVSEASLTLTLALFMNINFKKFTWMLRKSLYAPINVKPAGKGGMGEPGHVVRIWLSLLALGRAFDWSCSPGGGDIWIFLRPTWRYLTADSDEKDWDRTYVSRFHASRMRRTVWKDQEVMEANENKRRLSGFHCFVFKFRLF